MLNDHLLDWNAVSCEGMSQEKEGKIDLQIKYIYISNIL